MNDKDNHELQTHLQDMKYEPRTLTGDKPRHYLGALAATLSADISNLKICLRSGFDTIIIVSCTHVPGK